MSQFGDQGNEVREIQRLLNEAGFNLIEDGDFGADTEAVVKQFQANQGLQSDGIVGPLTLTALRIAAGQAASGTTSQHILGLDTASVADNHDPNWQQARGEAGINFAIIRACWGITEDSVFQRDWPQITDAGMVRGAYLYLRFPHPKYNMKAPDPSDQAKAFIEVVGDLAEGDLPPCLDVEFPGGRTLSEMSPQECLEGVRTAHSILVNRYSAAPILYTSARVWDEDLGNIEAPDLIESPLWLARYPFEKGSAVYDSSRLSTLTPPPVPPPWGDTTNWWIHQYQGDAQDLPGFPTGNVDLNRFNPLDVGASGDRVRWVQRRLGIQQSGSFDSVTENALQALQDNQGLETNGIVDIRTFARLCWLNA